MSSVKLARPHVDCCSCAHWLGWECVDCNRKSGGTSERYEAMSGERGQTDGKTEIARLQETRPLSMSTACLLDSGSCAHRSGSCAREIGSCTYQLPPAPVPNTELDGLRAENARLRRERLEQEAMSLEVAGMLRKAERERDEARAEVASWVEWSDHHSVWKVLASERPPPEEIRSELGGYLDDREQHLATLAQTISERDEARADSHRYSTECDMARLERDEAKAEVARRDALIKSDGYEDMRQHAQDLALQLEATRLDRDRALVRCREASQILIEAIGANGPENVEETAKRAAEHIESRRGVLAEVRLERDGRTAVWVDAVDLLAWLAAYAGVKVETKRTP